MCANRKTKHFSMDKLEVGINVPVISDYENPNDVDLVEVVRNEDAEPKPHRSKWRLQTTRLMLTYKTHLNKEKMKEFCKGFFPNNFICIMIFAHEMGKKKDYPHTHILLKFTKKMDTTDYRKFDYGELHPNIQTIKDEYHWNNSIKYMAKEDPENQYLIENPPLEKTQIEMIQESRTFNEALRYGELNQASSIKIVFDNRPVPKAEKPDVIKVFYKWQQIIFDYIKVPEDVMKREIIWVFDYVGTVGKSIFAEEVQNRLGKENVLILTNPSNMRDVSSIVETAKREHEFSGQVIIFDLPRSNYKMTDQQLLDFYGVIEALKNKNITSTKYNGRQVTLDKKPHIVIFANMAPVILPGITPDRWEILQLKDKDTIEKWTAADIKKFRERNEFEAEKCFHISLESTKSNKVGLGLATQIASPTELTEEERELKRRWALEDQNHHANFKLDTTNFDWSVAQTASNTVLANLNFGKRQ